MIWRLCQTFLHVASHSSRLQIYCKTSSFCLISGDDPFQLRVCGRHRFFVLIQSILSRCLVIILTFITDLQCLVCSANAWFILMSVRIWSLSRSFFCCQLFDCSDVNDRLIFVLSYGAFRRLFLIVCPFASSSFSSSQFSVRIESHSASSMCISRSTHSDNLDHQEEQWLVMVFIFSLYISLTLSSSLLSFPRTNNANQNQNNIY